MIAREPSFETVSELVRLDAATGKLYWLRRPVSMFSSERSAKIWNTQFSGKEAFNTPDGRGYLAGTMLWFRYKAHRIVWLMATGKWPSMQIDHINGNRADNRFENLREVENVENLRNAALKSNNTSGVCGVVWRQEGQKWEAKIGHQGKNVYLGRFAKLEDAIAARAKANEKLGYSGRHGAGRSAGGEA